MIKMKGRPRRLLKMKPYDELRRCLFGGLLFLPLICSMATIAWGQTLPPLARQLNPAETAIILVDFQNNFAATDGEHYRSYRKVFEETKMLESSVDLVKRARALGVQVIEVYEGYTPDYRELDWSNPGYFHRNQILRQAWKMGSKAVELYEPLRPRRMDKDILLPNRITVSGFGS